MGYVTNGTKNGVHNNVKIVDKFVKVDNVMTHTVQIGQLPEADGHRQRVLILVIPGNPGVPTYYEDFMRELHDQSGRQIPVWAIGQVGHSQPPDRSLTLKDVVATDEMTYGLQAQINHKVAFIQEYVPPDVKIILIGHSIGCYMILNILDRLPEHSVLRCFMLFPTLERMAISPNGISLTPKLNYFRYLFVLIAFFCILIPLSLRRKIIEFIYRDVEYPSCMTQAILMTVTPWTTNFSSYLAKLEMNQVTDLQKDKVKKHLDKLSLYYGSSDLWTPIQYYEDVIQQFPTIDARLCQLNMKHAFVMVRAEGELMAKYLWKWLEKSHLPKEFVSDSEATIMH